MFLSYFRKDIYDYSTITLRLHYDYDILLFTIVEKSCNWFYETIYSKLQKLIIVHSSGKSALLL